MRLGTAVTVLVVGFAVTMVDGGPLLVLGLLALLTLGQVASELFVPGKARHELSSVSG